MVSNPQGRVNLGHPTTTSATLPIRGLASAPPSIPSGALIQPPRFMFRALNTAGLSRLTHVRQLIHHVQGLLPPDTGRGQLPADAALPGYAAPQEPGAARPQPPLTVIKFAARPLSREFVACLRVMADSVIKGSRRHGLLNAQPPDQPPEVMQTSFATFYCSPYSVKFLSTFDGRIRGDSEWFSSLDDIQALFSQETHPDQRFTPHLTAQIHSGRLGPGARRALRELASVRGQGEEVLLRQSLAPEGLLLASGESDLPQRIHFGKQWIKNQTGQVVQVPPDALPFQWYVRWLTLRAHRHIENILLERALSGEGVDPLKADYETLDALLAPRRKMKKPPPDGLFVPGPETLLAAQTLMTALDGAASPRERQLLALLLDGASRQDAAAQLGITRATVDVLCSRLKQKYHAL
jgi:hypothetical protein